MSDDDVKEMINQYALDLTEESNAEGCWKCEHEGCGKPAGLYQFDQGPEEYLCPEHAHAHGFCYLCGEFWGGICSFDCGTGLCEHCQSEVDYAEDDDDEDMDFYDDY